MENNPEEYPYVNYSETSGDNLDAYSQYQKLLDHPQLTRDQEINLAKEREAALDEMERLQEEMLALPDDDPRCAELNKKIKAVAAVERHVAEAFIVHNQRLVHGLAVTIAPNNPSNKDIMALVAEGNIGLMHAVTTYDWRRDKGFWDYAHWWVWDRMLQATNQQAAIKVPHYMHRIVRNFIDEYLELEARFQQEYHRQPSNGEIIQRLGVAGSKLDLLMAAIERRPENVGSLDEHTELSQGEGVVTEVPLGHLVEEHLPDPTARAEDLIDRHMDLEQLREWLAPLEGRRSFDVLWAVYAEDMSNEQAADKLGMTTKDFQTRLRGALVMLRAYWGGYMTNEVQ